MPDLSASQLEAVRRYLEKSRRVQVRVSNTGPSAFHYGPEAGGSDDLLSLELATAFGTTSKAFVDSMMVGLIRVIDDTDDRRATRDLNAALATIDGMKPENEVEAMLLTQMAATHDASMKSLAIIGKGDAKHADIYGGLASKLLRSFVAQSEALAKLRRKGEQTVKVVHVHQGGQAIVTDTINHGGGGKENALGQSFGPDCAIAGGATLLGEDAARNAMPVAGNSRPATLPPTRRDKPRRTKGKS